jgi:4a-hydroxytetrahydrobiopterin dehydratase
VTGLSEDEIARALDGLPGWRFDRGEIFKWFRFASFREAVAFIVRIADLAEEADHHPDLENHFDRVRVALHTWSKNAVTEKDVSLAGAIEAAAT